MNNEGDDAAGNGRWVEHGPQNGHAKSNRSDHPTRDSSDDPAEGDLFNSASDGNGDGHSPGDLDPDHASAPDLLPVRMLNEYVYCPRLYHLMHVEGRWADNHFTVEGQVIHRRVDRLDHVLPDAVRDGERADANGDGDDGDTEALPGPGRKRKTKAPPDDGHAPPEISRSVSLGSPRLGIVAKLDLVATAGDEAVPVETKRGRVPNNEERSWEPERVQLMAQGLLLREHGYRCDHGVLYFAGSRTRVDVPFTAELESFTLDAITRARRAAQSTVLPPPLEESPKCHGCSLNGICLPDETLTLRQVPADPAAPETRRLYPARDEAVPLYVQEQGAKVGKSGETLTIQKSGTELARVRIKDVSQLVLCGSVQVSAQTLHLLCEAGIPVIHLSMGHWFYGVTAGINLRNAYDRAAQFAAAGRPDTCLHFAKTIVAAKGRNQRTILRRNAKPSPDAELRDMDRMLDRVADAPSIEALLGIEGVIARSYFSKFGDLLRPRDFDACWDWKGRNRRPPRDPVNAMLSFGYALLSKECTVALLGEGLDPWWGFYHRPRHGRPALALDLMEEFRPIIADSAVMTAVNTGMIGSNDFVRSSSGCVMKDTARKAFIRAYEARLDQLVTHPIFDYRCSYRAIIRLQARLLARWLRGDIPSYAGMVTR